MAIVHPYPQSYLEWISLGLSGIYPSNAYYTNLGYLEILFIELSYHLFGIGSLLLLR